MPGALLWRRSSLRSRGRVGADGGETRTAADGSVPVAVPVTSAAHATASAELMPTTKADPA